MTFSDLNPVQFWLIDCDTYNEEERYGLNHRCFCHPWECDDEIKTQFQHSAGLNFSLLIYDDEDSLLDNIPVEETSDGVYYVAFTPSDNTPGICDKNIKLQVRQNASEAQVPVSSPPLTDFDTTTGTPPTLASLASWVNAGGPNPGTWTLSATPDITVNGGAGVSGYIAGAIATDSSFSYEFNIQFQIFGDGAETENIDVTFALLDSSFAEVDTHLINYNSIGVKTPNFTLNGTSDGAYLAMRITNNTPTESKSFELQSASYVAGTVSFDWTLGANPTVNLPGTGPLDSKESELLFVDFAFTAGSEYTVTIGFNRVVNSGSSNPRTSEIFILNSSDVTQFTNSAPSNAGANTLSILFIANANTTRIGFTHNSGSNVDITVTSLVITVLQTTGTTQVLAKSDCLSIKETQKGTLLLTASNARNYAGIVNNNGSPELTFYLRIPAVFNEERFPEEEEPLQLSNNRIISLNSQVKAQKLLETDQMPFYMHRKMKLFLKNQFLSIEDKNYIQEEPYEEVENSNKRWPMRRYTCWLTEKEYVIRNIL